VGFLPKHFSSEFEMGHKNNKRKKRKASVEKKARSRPENTSTKRPDNIAAELNDGLRCQQAGQFKDAAAIYQKILSKQPNHADALHLLGFLAHQTGNDERAEQLIRRAIRVNPNTAFYYKNLGLVLKARNCLNEAADCYRKALAIQPNDAGVYYNLGIVYQILNRTDEAITNYQKTFQLNPAYALAYHNLGSVLVEANRLDEAIPFYQKTIALMPDYAEAYNNLGIVLGELGRYDEAIFHCRRALQLKPAFPEAYSNLFNLAQQTCDWELTASLADKLDVLTRQALNRGEKPAEQPFLSLKRNNDARLNLSIARFWSANIARRMEHQKVRVPEERLKFPGVETADAKTKISKIRIGYLSNNFRNHANAHLVLSLFGLHNRDVFKVFCYSYGQDDGSIYRQRIENDCDHFADLIDLNYSQSYKKIKEDRIDILVDLIGYTRGHRIGICARRPAPIQVRYLGFPGTTGASFFDYLITDRIMTPPDQAAYYSEHFVYMPHCYQINDFKQSIAEKNWNRREIGLPEDSFVFCSFNQAYKIEARMFDCWMRILNRVPDSVLWLLPGNEMAEQNLKKEAKARSISPERLIFAHTLSKPEHLARLHFADLALDTRLVSGHITTSDALWAGVPVITLMGEHFISRAPSSILTAVGLSDLITHSLDEYEALAVKLARTPALLKMIRQKLEINRKTEPLFDTPRFVANLEKAYQTMWKRLRSGARPRQIKVREDE
jgi:protein O-GlcNAc transferase